MRDVMKVTENLPEYGRRLNLLSSLILKRRRRFDCARNESAESMNVFIEIRWGEVGNGGLRNGPCSLCNETTDTFYVNTR